MLSEGAQAPAFELPAVDGTAVASARLLAQGPVLLFFFKISCPVCQMSAPFVQRIADAHGLQVFGISQDDEESTEEFNRHTGVKFPVLLDQGKKRYPVSNAYGIESVPSLFVIESDGQISMAFSGFSKEDFEALGRRAGGPVFRPDERVPAFRAG